MTDIREKFLGKDHFLWQKYCSDLTVRQITFRLGLGIYELDEE